MSLAVFFFFSSRRRHTRSTRDWSSDVCSSDLLAAALAAAVALSALAAGAGAAPAAPGAKVKKIAFFGFAAANSFAQATWKGVQDTAKKHGVQAKFFDPNFDAQKQVSQIQDAITSGDYQA